MQTHSYRKLSEGLRLARLARGYTFRAAAAAIGVEPSTIYRVETERSEPSLELVKRLCTLYEMDVNVAPDGLFVMFSTSERKAA